MEINEMTIEEMEARKAEIRSEVEAEDADLDALEAEVRGINEELEARKAAEAQRAELRAAVAAGEGEVTKTIEVTEERSIMTNAEIRNSAEYVDAFAKYIKTGSDKECRGLLTENVSGAIPVPEFVDSIVHTAWENDEILSRCRRLNVKGNLKVAFERSADGAYAHTEGTTAITEESLSLGIVTLLPKMVKKMLRISDEVAAMSSAEFIRYVYDELTYQITKKLADEVIGDIKGADTSHGSTSVGVPKVSAAPSVTTVATAAANLSAEARNPVVILNRLTEAAFVEAEAAANFAFDPFYGLPRVYTSALPAYSTASDNAVYAIVGDLNGETVNFPEGEGVIIKWDDLTEADADMIRIIGREYAAHGVTGPGKFVNIAKPAAATT